MFHTQKGARRLFNDLYTFGRLKKYVLDPVWECMVTHTANFEVTPISHLLFWRVGVVQVKPDTSQLFTDQLL